MHLKVKNSLMRRTRCPACGRTVASAQRQVRVHGIAFHADCAGYKRRAAPR